ncbi:MAG: twin-arginine translocase TatA/TatE family subunit [Chthoniobacterales bacterium]
MSTFIAFGMPTMPELFFIFLILLLVFGAKRLPELARSLGQSVNEFRKAKDEFDQELHKSPAPAIKIEEPKDKVAQGLPEQATPITVAPVAHEQPATPPHTPV